MPAIIVTINFVPEIIEIQHYISVYKNITLNFHAYIINSNYKTRLCADSSTKILVSMCFLILQKNETYDLICFYLVILVILGHGQPERKQNKSLNSSNYSNFFSHERLFS